MNNTAEPEIPVEQRILQLLQHLGIARAHIAARAPEDWRGIATRYPERVASLTLVCPSGVDARALKPLGSPLLVIAAGQGALAERVSRPLMELTDATIHTLPDYAAHLWSDVVSDRCENIATHMLGFLHEEDQRDGATAAVSLAEGEGEHAGLFYRIRGAGRPIVLLPLVIAPSQWEPLVPLLSQHYCTVTLGGPFVGSVASLEGRLKSGYGNVVQRLLQATHLASGQAVHEVGSGPGSIARWLARQTNGTNPIVGLDSNRYLLNEAMSLTRKEGLADVITFEEGNAEALRFPADSFDVTLSCTVLEEGDANRMLAELIRVTKPGGYVAVIVRAMDMLWWVNLPLDSVVKTAVEARMGSGALAQGCADASLYRRMRDAGLEQIEMFLQLATYTKGEPLKARGGRVLSLISPEQLPACRDAMAQAETEGTFFVAEPFHCAVGTKPL